MLTSTVQGRTAYLDADLHDPETILTSPELRDTLDLTRPVGLSLVSVLPFIPDDAVAHDIVRRLVEALPSGSYLVLTHITPDFAPEEMRQLADAYQRQGVPGTQRTKAEVERFFAGLNLVDPGVQVVHRWRPDGDAGNDLTDAEVSIYGGIARKN